MNKEVLASLESVKLESTRAKETLETGEVTLLAVSNAFQLLYKSILGRHRAENGKTVSMLKEMQEYILTGDPTGEKRGRKEIIKAFRKSINESRLNKVTRSFKKSRGTAERLSKKRFEKTHAKLAEECKSVTHLLSLSAEGLQTNLKETRPTAPLFSMIDALTLTKTKEGVELFTTYTNLVTYIQSILEKLSQDDMTHDMFLHYQGICKDGTSLCEADVRPVMDQYNDLLLARTKVNELVMTLTAYADTLKKETTTEQKQAFDKALYTFNKVLTDSFESLVEQFGQTHRPFKKLHKLIEAKEGVRIHATLLHALTLKLNHIEQDLLQLRKSQEMVTDDIKEAQTNVTLLQKVPTRFRKPALAQARSEARFPHLVESASEYKHPLSWVMYNQLEMLLDAIPADKKKIKSLKNELLHTAKNETERLEKLLKVVRDIKELSMSYLSKDVLKKSVLKPTTKRQKKK